VQVLDSSRPHQALGEKSGRELLKSG
jgi:hypothetical protein